MWLHHQNSVSIINDQYMSILFVVQTLNHVGNSLKHIITLMFIPRYLYTGSIHFKAAVLQNILKIISYNFFQNISSNIYIIVIRNKTTTSFHFFALKTDIRFPAIGIFLLYVTATALVTQQIMQRKTMFYQRFVN